MDLGVNPARAARLLSCLEMAGSHVWMPGDEADCGRISRAGAARIDAAAATRCAHAVVWGAVAVLVGRVLPPRGFRFSARTRKVRVGRRPPTGCAFFDGSMP